MRCSNCGIAIGRLRRHVVSSLDMPFQRLLVQWLTIQLPEDGHICHPCFLLLTSEGAKHRIVGHTMVCLGCGRSVRDIRRHIIESGTPLALKFSFAARLQGITRTYVCHPCWMKAIRHLNQDSSYEETSEPTDKTQNDNAMSPPLETPTLPPPAVLPPTQRSGYYYEPKEDHDQDMFLLISKKSEVTEPYGTIDATTSSGVCQVIEEDWSVGETPQTSNDDPVDVDENTQTSVADESMDYSIYRSKCNKIIANVYHYLQKEYVSLKSQLGGLCDVSVLSNTLARTAAATGVSQDEVEIALREAALHSDQTSNPEETVSSAAVRSPRTIRCYKRRSKTLEDKSDNSVRPPKRKATSIPSQLIDDEQLPFPAPIQLRVLGVETECKIEPVDEPLTMDDPLEAESSSHCDTAEESEIEIKTEPVDESAQNMKDDPLAPEWSPTALEEPSDPPNVSHTEMKSEHVDHDYADTCGDPSKYDKKRPDIKPKPPSQ